MKVYIEPRDWWIGYYRGDTHHYVCPLPTVVIRWPRKAKPPIAIIGGHYCPNCQEYVVPFEATDDTAEAIRCPVCDSNAFGTATEHVEAMRRRLASMRTGGLSG